MHRANAILKHREFCELTEKTAVLEKDRPFSLHDMNHFIDTARIAYILSLEHGAGIDKEIIYAAALLHDLGRARQYEDGTPHAQESARVAARILPECGFNAEEAELIIRAIREHSDKTEESGTLTDILYRADKLSRRCWECGAINECKWPEQKKNMSLEY